MSTVDDFRSELRAQIDRAQKQGRPHIEVNAGELHRVVGGYPGSGHRMPVCCQVMHAQHRNGDVIVFQPAEGKGASLTMRYKLPR